MRNFAIAAVLFAAAGPACAEDGLSAISGFSFASGRFAAPSRTNILVAPFGVRYSTGAVRFSATLPFLYVDSVGTVLLGNGAPVVIDGSNPAARRRARSGIGDLQLGASYALPETITDAWLIELSGQVKVPTADRRRGLGTGRTDVGLGIDTSRAFGRIIPFVNVGYRFIGSPSGFDLRNSVSTSAGVTYTVGKSFITASYDYNQAVTRFLPDAHELFLGVSGPAIGRLTWTAFGTAGLSDGAPGYGLGMAFSLKVGNHKKAGLL